MPLDRRRAEPDTMAEPRTLAWVLPLPFSRSDVDLLTALALMLELHERRLVAPRFRRIGAQLAALLNREGESAPLAELTTDDARAIYDAALDCPKLDFPARHALVRLAGWLLWSLTAQSLPEVVRELLGARVTVTNAGRLALAEPLTLES